MRAVTAYSRAMSTLAERDDHHARGVLARVRRAAAKGDPAALFELGCRHDPSHQDVPGYNLLRPSLRRAARYYRAAAERGNAEAMLALASALQTLAQQSPVPHRAKAIQRATEEAIQWELRAARSGGGTAALYNVAVSYLNSGRPRQAVRYFRRAAARGDDSALFELAKAELFGIGTRRRVKSAFEKLRRVVSKSANVCQLEREEAMLLMADVYRHGWLLPPDERARTRWLRRAALAGNLAAKGLLDDGARPEPLLNRKLNRDEPGSQRRAGPGAMRDANLSAEQHFLAALPSARALGREHERVRLLRRGVAQGWAAAQAELGELYIDGLRDPVGRFVLRPNEGHALRLLRAAAKAGDTEGMFQLALLLPYTTRLQRAARSKQAVRAAYVEAVRWNVRAFRQGCTSAAYNLAMEYRALGRAAQAVLWLERSAARGEVGAMLELAKAQLYGVGTRRNSAAAVRELERIAATTTLAAQADRREAMWLLAGAHLDGWLAPRNFDLAARWLERAAREGSAGALGMLREHGIQLE